MTPLALEQPPESLCILRLSAIGDVTHVLPVIATLQQQWPATRITWIIGKLEYQLVKSLPDIEFIIFDKSKGLAEYRNLSGQLRKRRFDVLLMMQVALRANLISTLIRANNRIGYDKLRSRDFHTWFCNQHIEGPARVHVLDSFFQFIEKLGITERRMDWLLQADSDSRTFARQQLADKPTVIINPCSSARKNNWRNWPQQNYAEILDYLIGKLGLQVILTGGPSRQEQDFAEDIIGRSQHQPLNLVGKTSLMQLLALLEQAQCLLAPDTGPAHMATVAGTPVIGLYASSNPLRSGPYNSQSLTINAYPEALTKYNDKSLDQARWGERVRHPQVMDMISVERVKQKLDQCLSAS